MNVLGIGNALTDILLQLDTDTALNRLNLPKGSMQLVGDTRQDEISRFLKDKKRIMAAGGSAANTVCGIARLGGEAGFIGKIGRDEVGEFFRSDMLANGVRPHLLSCGTASGRCLALVSPDGERTMCTYLGAAAMLEGSELQADLLRSYDIFHIEGYLVQNHDLLHTAVRLAREAGMTVSIDLASYNIVEENQDFLRSIVADYVDIVFANEEEARAFTGKEPLDALDELASLTRIAVVKVGKEGSHLKSGDHTCHISAGTARCKDTTGAGDLYAAGFLYGIAQGLPLDTCGAIGALVAEHIITVMGAKMPDETWEEIRSQVESLKTQAAQSIH